MTYSKLMEKKWVILLMLFGLFTPQYLSLFEVVQILARGIRLLSYILILTKYMASIKKHIYKTFNISLLFLWVGLFLSTILSNGASLDTYFISLRQSVMICLLIELLAIYMPVNGLCCLYWYFSVCVLINTLTVFLFPNAMYANNRGIWVCWFLGEDNSGYIYYIFASTMAMIYTHCILKRNTVLCYLVWASAFIFVFYRDIATGKACQIIWLFLVLGYRFGWFRKLLKGRYILYAIVGGFIVIVLNRKAILEPIVSALGRNITLTGRTILWDTVLERMRQRPLIGFGMYTAEDFDQMMLNNGILNAHNWLLMLMFYGGIIAVVLFSATIICSYRNAKEYRNNTFYRCLIIGLMVLAVRFLVEAGGLSIMFMMLAMMAYTKEFTQGLEDKQVQKKYIFKGMPKFKMARRGRFHI